MKRVLPISIIAAIAGFALWGLGLWLDPARAWHAYLAAFALVASIAVGGLIFLMIGYATGGRWMAVTRRLNEAITLPMPALAVLFVPLFWGAGHLYPWRQSLLGRPEHVRHLIEHRSGYLNLPGFAIRGLVFLAIFVAVAELLRAWSLRRDGAEEPPDDPAAALKRERVLSVVGLPLVGLAITFAAIDWVMSLEPVWFSTIFGVYFFAGGFVAALALLTALAAAARRSLEGAITGQHFYALGRLMFAFVVFWAYAAFFQAMLIALANKPEEIGFYLARTEGAWSPFVYVLVLGHFAIPFFVLLGRRLKSRPRIMAAAAAWILLMHAVDVHWLVIPRDPGGPAVHWIDLAAYLAVGGVAVAVAAWRQGGRSLLATGDPFLPEGRAYRSPL